MNLQRMLLKLAVVFTFILSSSSVFAVGATVSFTAANANPTAVPTLSGWMLIILSLLLFAVAVKITRQKGSNAGKFFLLIMGIGVLSSSTEGVKLLSDLHAGVVFVPVPVTTVSAVGVFTITGVTIGSEEQIYHNTSGQSLNFSIVADDEAPNASMCGYQIFTAAPEQPTPDMLTNGVAQEHNGTLLEGRYLLVRCSRGSAT